MTEHQIREAQKQRDALWEIWALTKDVDWDDCLVCADVAQLCEQALWRGEVGQE